MINIDRIVGRSHNENGFSWSFADLRGVEFHNCVFV
jgi:hypothetical protein